MGKKPAVESSPVDPDRLLRSGPTALTDGELLVLLLDGPDVDSAEALLAEAGGLGELLCADVPTLEYWGLSDPNAFKISASGELARRLAGRRLESRPLLKRPEDVTSYIRLRFGVSDQEIMGAFFVDIRNRWIGEAEIFRGTMTQARVEPRAILRQALVRRADGIVLFHTHPGGEPDPTSQDLQFTVAMVKACETVGVRFIDHLVVAAEGSWVSMKGRCPDVSASP